MDLSHQEDQSVNDGISESRCSLLYVSVEEAARTVLELERGTRMAKVDIRNAYRNIPVHPDDRWLLGMSWRRGIFIDAVLPFGLRSAHKIFNSVADALQWIVRNVGVKKVFHYLDDFLVLGAPGSEECADGLTTLLGLTEWLGFPVATEKVEEPTTRLTFLGIEIDSESLTLTFTEEKLVHVALKTLLFSWKDCRWCRKTELQSLAGKLQHACKVVRPGRSFLRRVFEQLKGTHHNHHHIRLNRAIRSDLIWWDLFLDSWNGVSLLRPARLMHPDHNIYTDTSGSVGCGAVWAQQWFQFEWPQEYAIVPKAPKEFLPIMMACVVWGHAWQGRVVHVHTDNEAVVAVVNSGYSKDPQIMHLVRRLFFVLATWDISLYSHHIAGVLNTVADAISRNNIPLLYSKVPGADPMPTTIPAELVELLVTSQPDWTLPSWGNLFRSCLQQV